MDTIAGRLPLYSPFALISAKNENVEMKLVSARQITDAYQTPCKRHLPSPVSDETPQGLFYGTTHDTASLKKGSMSLRVCKIPRNC